MAGNTPLEAVGEWIMIFGAIGAGCVAWIFLNTEKRALFVKDGTLNLRVFKKVLWETFGKASMAFFVFGATVVAGLVGKSLVTSFSGRPNQESIDERLIEGFRKYVEEENRNLPMMVNADTRLDAMIVGPGPRMTYLYTFPKYSSQAVSITTLQDQLRPLVRNSVCTSTDMQPSLQYGATYVYAYRSNDGVEVARFSFNRKDCGLSPKL